MSTEPRGVLSVVTDAVRQAANLIQLEFRLARAELAEKAIELKAGLALVVAGAVLLTATLFLLLQAAVAVLVEAGLSPPLATLLVAAACAAAGIILTSSARKHLEPEALAPKRIMNELTRDSALATIDSFLRSCAAVAAGPICVPACSGSPSRIASARATRRSITWS